MYKKTFYISVILIIVTSTSFLFRTELLNMYSFSRATLSYYGSSGDEVKRIQSKLYNWGYYKGKVDGIYGYQTYTAVKYFQGKNGLQVDGVAGNNTLNSLGIMQSDKKTTATVAATSINSYSNNTKLLARVIHGEARGENYSGKVAVAAVVLNRARDSRFPKTISGVIYQKGAFDCVSDGQINLTPNQASISAANDALNGWDPTYGCVYYWNPKTATSKWIWTRNIMLQIGKHIFAK